jgi:predicted enzyme involved in methoxymalonyl-ACP biosynthesis
MLDAIAEAAVSHGIRTIFGTYLPTKKNGMVAAFYSGLGFVPHIHESSVLPEGATMWKLNVAGYVRRNKHIKMLECEYAR